MLMRELGKTGIEVSALCLGSMTWGTQNTCQDAAEQIDYALDHGVNFIDTAEMYPTTPLHKKTLGDTERCIGEWVASSGKRQEVLIATKVTGKGKDWMYGGQDITGDKIHVSVERSLERLQTDVIDLYQLHWPNRGSYHFRQNWTFDPSNQDTEKVRNNIHEVLLALDKEVKAGRIRHIGLSNESAWGAAQYLSIAEANGLPRVVSIQNEYNLMHRLFDLDLAEVSHHESVGLLAFSPLAAGALSGKYSGGVVPDGSRRQQNKTLSGRYTRSSELICERYVQLARDHGLDPAQMALSFCLTRPFMTSAIIGATTMDQLKTNIQAADLTLDEAVMQDIHALYLEHPIPMNKV